MNVQPNKRRTIIPTIQSIIKKKEITPDLYNDIEIAFKVFKNDKNKISKTKLRTILYSFILYKSPAREINEIIVEMFQKKEEFSFDDVISIVNKYVYI